MITGVKVSIQSVGHFLHKRTFAAVIPVLLFAGAYAASFGKLSDQWGSYLFCTAVSAAAAGAVVFKLIGRGKAASAAWLTIFIMAVFGYGKFFWILFDPITVRQFFPVEAWPAFADKKTLLSAYSLLTVGFVCLSISSILTLSWLDSRKEQKTSQAFLSPADSHRTMKNLAWIIVGLLPACLLIIWKFRIGVTGVIPTPLPMRLSGIVYYTFTIVIPALILTQVFVATQASRLPQSRVWIAVLFLWAVADAALRGSRGTLFLAPLMLVFLGINGGLRLKRAEVFSILALVFVGVLVVPIVAQYRFLRGVDGMGVFAALRIMSANISFKGEVLLNSAVFIFFRIPGVETLIAVLGMGSEPLGLRSLSVLTSARGLEGYLTQEIFHVSLITSYAPAFLAGGYVLGGNYMLAAISALAGGVATLGGKFLNSFSLRSAPVCGTFFFLLLFWGMTEGPTTIYFRQAAVSFLTLVLLEVFMRFSDRQASR